MAQANGELAFMFWSDFYLALTNQGLQPFIQRSLSSLFTPACRTAEDAPGAGGYIPVYQTRTIPSSKNPRKLNGHINRIQWHAASNPY